MNILSSQYVVFVGIALATYWVIPARWRAGHLAAASAAFMAAAGPDALALLVVAVAATWFAGVAYADGRRFGRPAVIASVVVSIVVFFTGKVLGALTIDFNFLDSTILPLGFSFYTFQTIAYSVELLRGSISAERNLLRLAAYISFFPHLTAGPVLAPGRVLPEFQERLLESRRPEIAEGLELMLLGVFKKVVLADFAFQLLLVTDFDVPAQRVAIYLILPLAAYFDISGLLNIARGTGKLFAIELPRSFIQPLTHGRNVVDYWRRWQVPLFSWFREYVYRPVSARITGPWSAPIATAATFLIASIWHALRWDWLIWGGCTVAAILADRALQSWLTRTDRPKWATVAWRQFRRAALLVYVFGTNFVQSLTLDLQSLGASPADRARTPTGDVLTTLVVLTLFLILLDDYEHERMTRRTPIQPTIRRGLAWGVAVVGIVVFWDAAGFIPFTYEGF